VRRKPHWSVLEPEGTLLWEDAMDGFADFVYVATFSGDWLKVRTVSRNSALTN
jgi:hypothetical protein